MSDQQNGSLSLEQQFKLTTLTKAAKQLTLEEAQQYVIELTRQMMVKDNLVRDILKAKV